MKQPQKPVTARSTFSFLIAAILLVYQLFMLYHNIKTFKQKKWRGLPGWIPSQGDNKYDKYQQTNERRFIILHIIYYTF